MSDIGVYVPVHELLFGLRWNDEVSRQSHILSSLVPPERERERGGGGGREGRESCESVRGEGRRERGREEGERRERGEGKEREMEGDNL